jgi:hypothetical protein
VLIIKGVMQHWPNSETLRFLRNCLPNYRMAIITKDFCTWHDAPQDTWAGGGQCFDLRDHPFDLRAQLILDWQSAKRRKHVLRWKRDPADGFAIIRGYSE